MAEGSKQGNKNRKYGRKIDGAKIYLQQNRLVKNQKRKLAAHCRKHPEDLQAVARLNGASPRTVRSAPINSRWNTASKFFAAQLRFIGYKGHTALNVKDAPKPVTTSSQCLHFPRRKSYQFLKSVVQKLPVPKWAGLQIN